MIHRTFRTLHRNLRSLSFVAFERSMEMPASTSSVKELVGRSIWLVETHPRNSEGQDIPECQNISTPDPSST